jgi:hypothetical protein
MKEETDRPQIDSEAISYGQRGQRKSEERRKADETNTTYG